MQSDSHSGDEKTSKNRSGDASLSDSQNGPIAEGANKLAKKLGKKKPVKGKAKAESFIECDFVPIEPEQTQVSLVLANALKLSLILWLR